MRHASAPLLAAVLAAALAGCGQPFLSARIEVPELRLVTEPQEFPAASVDPQQLCSTLVAVTGRTCSGVTTSYDLGGEVPGIGEKGVKLDLRLKDLALHLTSSGLNDLRGVTRAEVGLRDPASGGLTRIAGYARSPGALPTTIAVSGASNLDLSPYLSDGKLDARVEVEMDPAFLPTGFSAAIEAGFSVVVTVSYRSL